MSDIRHLRNEGRLDEAYQLGKELCANEPDNIWVKRDFSWTCYDLMKLAIRDKDKTAFIVRLQDIASLHLPKDEEILGNALPWIMRQWLLQNTNNNSTDNIDTVNRLLYIAQNLPLQIPSAGASALIKTIHKVIKGTHSYCDILDKIGFNWMRTEDYQPLSFENQHSKIMSLAEQVCIAYSKTLLQEIENQQTHNYNPEHTIEPSSQKRLDTFLPWITWLIEQHPEYTYPIYYKARLLLRIGKQDQIIQLLTPFVQKKAKEFWVWQLLGESVQQQDKSLALSCFCKALSCPAQKEAMLVNLRESAAEIMAQQGFFNEARTEIDTAENVRLSSWGKTSKLSQKLKSSEWYHRANAQKDNKNFYKAHCDLAESLIYASNKELILITYVNSEKNIANFLKENDKNGFFSYRNLFKIPPMIGELYEAVIQESPGKPISIIKWHRKWDGKPQETPFYKIIDGKIKISNGKNFGFINQVFIAPSLIQKEKLSNGQQVSALAMRSFDRKKSTYGWSIVSILDSSRTTPHK